MRILTAEALILDVVDLQEQDRIVSFLTREHGRRRGVARGAKRKHSRWSGQLQPLAKVQATWFEKEGRELVRLQSIELVRAAPQLLYDLESILHGSYVAEHVGAFAQEDTPSDPLYRLLDAAIVALGEGAPRPLVSRYVESWVLRLEGVFPAPRECPSCGGPLGGEAGAWLLDDGAIVCAGCRGPRPVQRVGEEALAFLRRIGREGVGKIAAAPPPAEVLDEVESIAARVRRAFLGAELRSYEMMRRTLARVPAEPIAEVAEPGTAGEPGEGAKPSPARGGRA